MDDTCVMKWMCSWKNPADEREGVVARSKVRKGCCTRPARPSRLPLSNTAWIYAGGHDGDRHADTDSKVSQDPMPPRSLLLPPPLHSSPPDAGTLPFGEFVLSDVCSKLTKLTGHAVRSTYTNKVWLCVDDHDGTKHPGTGCGIFRDLPSTPFPPPSPDTRQTHTHAPPPTIRMIYIRLATARAVTLF